METTSGSSPRGPQAIPRRRIRSAGGVRRPPVERVRYILPKTGSSAERPELDQEAANEAEALVEAFRSTQVFYTLVAWSAFPELHGSQAKISKRPLARE